eukprot:95879-Pleurochrysis_carterae.AAC.1
MNAANASAGQGYGSGHHNGLPNSAPNVQAPKFGTSPTCGTSPNFGTPFNSTASYLSWFPPQTANGAARNGAMGHAAHTAAIPAN